LTPGPNPRPPQNLSLPPPSAFASDKTRLFGCADNGGKRGATAVGDRGARTEQDGRRVEAGRGNAESALGARRRARRALAPVAGGAEKGRRAAGESPGAREEVGSASKGRHACVASLLLQNW